jgi:hypothetical protein
MNVTDYATKDYVGKQELFRMEKQTQTNPILPAIAGKIALSL